MDVATRRTSQAAIASASLPRRTIGLAVAAMASRTTSYPPATSNRPDSPESTRRCRRPIVPRPTRATLCGFLRKTTGGCPTGVSPERWHGRKARGKGCGGGQAPILRERFREESCPAGPWPANRGPSPFVEQAGPEERMQVHRVGRVAGALGVILVLGGCGVEVNKPHPHTGENTGGGGEWHGEGQAHVGQGPAAPAP